MTEHAQPPDEDDDEYELEPIDPEILEKQRLRSEEKSRQARRAVEIDEVSVEPDERDPFGWEDFQGFRFTTRHLLIATALLAVFLTLAQRENYCLALFIAAIVAVAAGWFFVLRKERRVKLVQERRRAEVIRRHAEEAAEEVDYSEFEQAEPASTRPEFRFSFSMKELFGAMTVAALTFALVRALGGPDSAAILLGSIALLGLVIHLLGFDPPPVIILGWWLLLVLYIVVSLWAAFGSDSVAWATTIPLDSLAILDG